MTTNEQWRPIPGYAPYEASSEGRIRNSKTGHMMSPAPINGRLAVTVFARDHLYVHKAVAAAFFGPINAKVEHKNGDQNDCRACNLKYVVRTSKEISASDNIKPYRATPEKQAAILALATEGLTREEIADRVGLSSSTVVKVTRRAGVTLKRKRIRLSIDDVRCIKQELIAAQLSMHQIADKYDVDTSLISLIASGKRWAAVASEPSDD